MKNIKIFLILSFIIIFITGLYFMPFTEKELTKEESYILGYCPTMESYALDIQNKNPNLTLLLLENSSSAIDSLNNNDVDFIIIGRFAEEKEILSPSFKKLTTEKRYTFVSKNKSFVSIEDLSNLKIHTYLDEKVINEIFNKGQSNIIFHDALESSIKEGLNDVILIAWDDYNDSLQLVVILENNQKVEKFRFPLLYSIKHDIEIINI